MRNAYKNSKHYFLNGCAQINVSFRHIDASSNHQCLVCFSVVIYIRFQACVKGIQNSRTNTPILLFDTKIELRRDSNFDPSTELEVKLELSNMSGALP